MNTRVEIRGVPGEYTGLSFVTGKHYFSMYNGSVIRLTEPEVIRILGKDFLEKINKETHAVRDDQKN